MADALLGAVVTISYGFRPVCVVYTNVSMVYGEYVSVEVLPVEVLLDRLVDVTMESSEPLSDDIAVAVEVA